MSDETESLDDVPADLDAEEEKTAKEEAAAEEETTAETLPSVRDIALEAALADALEAHEDPLEMAPYLPDEFILWVWYRSERDFTTFHLSTGETVDLWIDDKLAFASSAEDKAVSTFRGGAPSTLPEARLSVLSGRRIQEARFGMRRGEAEWNFVLKVKAGDLLVSGLKIPSVVKDDAEEMIYERAYLMDSVEEVLGDLFTQYFKLRTSPEWETGEREETHNWLMGGGEDDD